jgi:hypothetical protein
MTFTHLTRRLVIAAAFLFVLAGKPARAQQESPNTQQCMSAIASCYYWAALQAGFWGMWSAGIDCELVATDCIRRALIGW